MVEGQVYRRKSTAFRKVLVEVMASLNPSESYSKKIKRIPSSSEGVLVQLFRALHYNKEQPSFISETETDVSFQCGDAPQNFKAKVKSLKRIFSKKLSISHSNVHKYIGIEHGLYSVFRVLEGHVIRDKLSALDVLRQKAQEVQGYWFMCCVSK